MRRVFRILLIVAGSLLAVVLLLFAIGCWLYFTSDYREPNIAIDRSAYTVTTQGDSCRVCGNNSIVRNDYGLWEVYVEGSPADRGAAYGALCEDILKYQEKVFVDQIHELVPSEGWVEFLHKLIGIFNRNMASHIPEEFREEIFSFSAFCSHEYDAYGTPYQRQLNYHAAHDIGHALQEYMLVGCSAFAAWDGMSEGGKLTVARNFDFYVGDAFAENKIVLFVEPESGYRFASVTWPGMVGVLSGMNEKGLTVSINAAKGAIPTSSAMPISLLTRQILQYASNIGEAYEIASSFETFVSESILIGSAADGCAAVIEKTPEKIALYRTDGEYLISTNHYRSEAFADDAYNVENIETSDSPYRYERIEELIGHMAPIDREDAVSIMRDWRGRENADIGLTNEKSLNQFIAHHSVVFSPEDLKMWVSTSPWQLGAYVCYDLNGIFALGETPRGSMIARDEVIPADSTALEKIYPRVVKYREQSRAIRHAIDRGEELPQEFMDDFIANNPNLFRTYELAGDYMLSVGDEARALDMWRAALEREIPRRGERESIESKIEDYDKE